MLGERRHHVINSHTTTHVNNLFKQHITSQQLVHIHTEIINYLHPHTAHLAHAVPHNTHSNMPFPITRIPRMSLAQLVHQHPQANSGMSHMFQVMLHSNHQEFSQIESLSSKPISRGYNNLKGRFINNPDGKRS